MIKTITIKKKVVVCDLCGGVTEFDSDQGYVQQEKHFCQNHREEEELWEKLGEWPNVQKLFFEEAITGRRKIVREEKKTSDIGLHPSITKVGNYD